MAVAALTTTQPPASPVRAHLERLHRAAAIDLDASRAWEEADNRHLDSLVAADATNAERDRCQAISGIAHEQWRAEGRAALGAAAGDVSDIVAKMRVLGDLAADEALEPDEIGRVLSAIATELAGLSLS